MAEDRPFPPSPRRAGLARRAGLHAASPLLVGAAASGAAVLVIGVLARAAAARLGASIEAACHGTPRALAPGDAVQAVVDLALPALGAVALIAVIAHVAQTRSLWMPRRTLAGAPRLDAGPGARTQHAGFELASAGVIGGVAVGWLWLVVPRLAALPSVPQAGASLIASALAALAIAWFAVGVMDALLRHRDLGRALRMTAQDKREDDRLAAADPRWRELRARAHGAATPRDAIAGSTLLLLGDDAAVAIAWDPLRRPIPIRTATGRGPRATQLLGLARHVQLAVHRDPQLVELLVGHAGPVPEAHWTRLAEIIAALRAR
ncbi:MAG: FlhB HrpN YscU SpaS Family [Deltaproteobacteria bacterium]|nr:FlhB HrpN YscU SpaS Family [Deltaproteobacteria bacterium]